MATPNFVEEKSLSLVDVKELLTVIEKRDGQLNHFSNKAKEYLEIFVKLSEAKKKEIEKKLAELELTRLKPEHIAKIIDFMPKDATDLKVLLQGYYVSLPKKDQESILAVVKNYA